MIIHNASITGSFSVNGTNVASITSSQASIDALNTFSSSILSFTASTNTFTASAATTGSNTFVGNQVVSGSLTVFTGSAIELQVTNTGVRLGNAITDTHNVTGSLNVSGSITTPGTLTAQTLVVQTVTSSVVYSSGSNVFGNNIANTQVFTGSMNLTGSLTVVTIGTEFQVGATGVNLGNALTDSHVISGSLTVNPGGLFVSSSGNVGIGISTPPQKLTIVGGTTTPGSFSGGNYTFGLYSGSRESFAIGGDASYVYMQSFTSRPLYLNQAGNNIILGSAANAVSVGVGTVSPNYRLDVNGTLGVSSNATITGSVTTTQLIGSNTGNVAQILLNTSTAVSPTSFIRFNKNDSNKWDIGSNVGGLTSDEFSFYSSGSNTNVFVIKQNGNVNIGSSTSSGYGLLGNSNLATSMGITFHNGSTYSKVGGVISVQESGGSHALALYTRSGGDEGEKMRITSGGNVFVNNPSGVSLNGLTNFLSVSSTTYNLFDISRFSDNAFGPNFYLVKSRNGTIGGNTIVANGDNLGNISWLGANGTGFTDAANIRAEVDGTPGTSNDMPGRLVFSTTADGAGSVTERMRITSGGSLQMSYNPGGGDIYFRDATNGAVMFYIIPATYVGTAPFNNNRILAANSSNIVFEAGGGTRMAISSGGLTTITGPSLSAGSQGTYALNVGQSGNTSLALSMNGTAGYIQTFASTPLYLNQQGNSVLANGTNGFGTVNTTSSDIRIKKNIVSIESALDKVNALRGVYYEFDKDNELEVSVPHGKTRVGLIAQEVETIIPEAVLGGDNENTPKSVDYTGLVGILVKAIQELKAEFDEYKLTHP